MADCTKDKIIIEALLAEIINIPNIDIRFSQYIEQVLMALLNDIPVVIDVPYKEFQGFQRPIGVTHLARAKINMAKLSVEKYKSELNLLSLVCFYWE